MLFHALGLIAVSLAWDTLRIGVGKTYKHSMKGTCLTTGNSWHTWWFLRIWLKLTMINFKQISVGGSRVTEVVKMVEKLVQNWCSGSLCMVWICALKCAVFSVFCLCTEVVLSSWTATLYIMLHLLWDICFSLFWMIVFIVQDVLFRVKQCFTF